MARPVRLVSLKDAINPNHPASGLHGLRRVISKRASNRELLQIVRACVKEKLREHILYTTVRNEKLAMVVDSSAHATLIRVDSRRILAEVTRLNSYAKLQGIDIQVSRTAPRPVL